MGNGKSPQRNDRVHISGFWLAFFLTGHSFWADAYERVTMYQPKRPFKKISPYIYGLGTYMHENRNKEGIWALYPAIYRWGGNTSSTFNYKINAWNIGADWYFKNASSSTPNMIDSFIAQNRAKKVASSITLPLLGWVAKNNHSASFPRCIFPNQSAYDGNAGSGVDKNSNKELFWAL